MAKNYVPIDFAHERMHIIMRMTEDNKCMVSHTYSMMPMRNCVAAIDCYSDYHGCYVTIHFQGIWSSARMNSAYQWCKHVSYKHWRLNFVQSHILDKGKINV